MKVRFGIMADAHVDFIHDGEKRVNTFLNACQENKCDFCIDLGDFCPPSNTNRKIKENILKTLKKYPIPFYYIIGNHDTDNNEKDTVRAYLKCTNQKKSFDFGGVHFMLVDACAYREGKQEFEYNNGNYKNTCGEIPILTENELSFIKKDLNSTNYPTVVFSHQSLIESRTGIKNPEQLREIFKTAKNKVLLCICGHEHVDRLEQKDGVYYLCLNSMSYYYAGEQYTHNTYDESITKKYSVLKKVFPYKEPLFAIIEIDDNEIRVLGRESEIVGALPESLSFEKKGLVDPITATIKNRTLPIIK